MLSALFVAVGAPTGLSMWRVRLGWVEWMSEDIEHKRVQLTRETIRSGHMQRMIAAANPNLRLLSEA